MRLYSLVCLLFVFVVILDSVTSYPAAGDDDTDFRPSTAAKKHHGKLSKKHRANHRHSSRGLKEASDYDAGLAQQQSTVWTPDAQSSDGAKYRKIPLVKQDRRRTKKRQGGKSKRKKNKRSGGGKKATNKDSDRKMAASLRTARRADPDGPLYDATIEDATPKQLLGLGVFGDMRKFFDELRTNLDTDDAMGAAASAIAESDRVKAQDPSVSSVNDPGFEEYEELPNYQALRTMTSDGYGGGLTAPDSEHQQRRQYRLRGFVSMAGAGWPSEPSRHHRARQYDPALLWTGLGR